MTTLREAAQMALDALIDAADSQSWELQQNIDQHGDWYRRSVYLKQAVAKSQESTEALRAALAQPTFALNGIDCSCGRKWRVENGVITASAQPEQEPVTTLFGSLPVYDVPPKQQPVAWRTFDGEGNYEFRDYEMNENYAEEWNQRNPNYKGWVEPLYKDPTPCKTCEALARTVMMDQTSHDNPPQREWIGLMDEEIREFEIWLDDEEEKRGWNPPADIVKYIEAKLKEKNT